MSAASDAGLNFSSKMSSSETTSIMSDTELNISQLIFLLQILRYKLESKLFDLEYKMKELCGETISPQFGEYIYIYS